MERLRIQKGIYWQGATLTKVESTFVDGIYAYYDGYGKMFLVDETVSFVKFLGKPWWSLASPPIHMIEQDSDAIKRKTFQAWVNHKTTFPMTFGAGGKHKYIYVTAPDCPYAKQFDEVLKVATKDLDVTLYTHLTSINNQPAAQAAISDTLCASNPQNLWFKLRAGQAAKGASCQNQSLNQTVLQILISDKILNTPTLIAEDGSKVNIDELTTKMNLGLAKTKLIRLLNAQNQVVKSYF